MKLFFIKALIVLQSEESFFSDPNVVQTIIAVIIILFGLAHLFRIERFKGFGWIVSPASTKQRDWLNSIGEKWYSRLMGSIYTFFGLLILYLIWWI